MDQVIFEEFKGTGNMELTLDRSLANLRIYPAINIPQSGTRKEELLIDPKQIDATRRIRRLLTDMAPQQALKTMLDVLSKHKTNADMLNSMKL
jgi:transcription termination factor Rho